MLWILIDVPIATIVVSLLKEMALSVVISVGDRFIQNVLIAVVQISIMKTVFFIVTIVRREVDTQISS